MQLSNYNCFDLQLQNYHYHIADFTLQDMLRKVYQSLLYISKWQRFLDGTWSELTLQCHTAD